MRRSRSRSGALATRPRPRHLKPAARWPCRRCCSRLHRRHPQNQLLRVGLALVSLLVWLPLPLLPLRLLALLSLRVLPRSQAVQGCLAPLVSVWVRRLVLPAPLPVVAQRLLLLHQGCRARLAPAEAQ